MLGNRRLRQRQLGHDLAAHTRVARQQETEDPHARWVSQRLGQSSEFALAHLGGQRRYIDRRAGCTTGGSKIDRSSSINDNTSEREPRPAAAQDHPSMCVGVPSRRVR